MTEAQVACLTDREEAEFTPGERAAIAFAEEFTRGTRVGDRTFADLRRHWNDRQIVEIAAVAGLFDYFNRFNNALEVELTVYPRPLG